METIALAKETAIDPYLLGDLKIFSVTSAILRNIVPRRHISFIILLLVLTSRGLREGYDSAATGEIARTRSFGMTGSKNPCFSFHWNSEDSRPVETASRH